MASWLDKIGRGLHAYRPRFRDGRFWAVQGLVVLIAGLHTGMEAMRELGYTPVVGASPQVSLLSFVPVSLFFIPVVYAALNFGFVGSVATAAWCTLLTVPNFALHPGAERVREMMQVGIVDAIAIFVGQRVDREMSARQNAESAGAALRASEIKYRGLFNSSPVPVLVLDPQGKVMEANPGAGLLFGRSPAVLSGMGVADLLGPACAKHILDGHNNGGFSDAYPVPGRAGAQIYLEPSSTQASDSEGKPIIQVLLRDVTEERHRQAGLKAYAAHILRAQEEERRRIAQELHDETVQSLILLCRRLDTVEGAQGKLPDQVVEGLRQTRASAEAIVEGLRGFARALRPPILEDLGLVTSIRRLVVDLGERTSITGQLRVVGQERRLPPDIELGVFRIAQEALRNVERHARATQVAATVTFGPHELRLDIADNGAGFTPTQDPRDFAARGQLGLLGMRERAEILGGGLDIHSSPGRGAKVSLSVPIQAESTAAVGAHRQHRR